MAQEEFQSISCCLVFEHGDLQQSQGNTPTPAKKIKKKKKRDDDDDNWSNCSKNHRSHIKLIYQNKKFQIFCSKQSVIQTTSIYSAPMGVQSSVLAPCIPHPPPNLVQIFHTVQAEKKQTFLGLHFINAPAGHPMAVRCTS